MSGTCLLLVAGSATRTGVSRLLGFGPITRIGDLSYSWYLWHWPLIVFARSLWPGAGYVVPVAALTSLFPAWLAYRYLENPVRLDSRLVGRRAFSLALICIVVPVLASLALSRARLPGQSPETAARLVALSQRHVDEIRHCESGELTERCTWPVARDRGTVMLVGDSNAAQFIEPASRAANAKGYSFSVLTRHACRFVDVIVVRAGRRDPACRSYVVETLRTLEQQSPVLVFIASSSPGIVNSPNIALEDPVTGRVARTLRAKSRAWSEGVTRVHRQLSDAHIPTVLIQTIPQFPNWHPNCAAIRAYLDPQSCGASLLRAEVDEYRSAALDAENRGLRSVPGSVSLDFADLLCGRTKCSTNQGNFWYYRDNYHLSVRGSLRLTPAFVECIVTHARDERPSALHSTEPVPTCQDRVRRPV